MHKNTWRAAVSLPKCIHNVIFEYRFLQGDKVRASVPADIFDGVEMSGDGGNGLFEQVSRMYTETYVFGFNKSV